jgi:transglutaminase-like putative cysteine protease
MSATRRGAASLRDQVVLRGVTAALLAASASCFTILGWSGLAVDPGGYIRPLVLIAIGVAVTGIVLRSLGLPRPLVVAVQVAGTAEVLHLLWSQGTATAGLVPNATSLGEVADTVSRAVTASRQWAAPVPADVPSFDPLMIAIGAAVILCVDAYAVTYRRSSLAGLALLAAFTLPVAVTGGMRWDHFMLAACAFLLMVAAEHLHTVGRWGRPLTGISARGLSDEHPAVPTTGAMLTRNRGALVRVLAPSLLVAVAGSLLVPEGSGFFGRGGSGDSGAGDVRIDNPIVDLRRDLVEGPDYALLDVTTDDPDPSYLRISALDSFDGDTWRPSRRELPPSQRIGGELPDPFGLNESVQQVPHGYELAATDDLTSDWLPLPFPAVAAEAEGDWRYDKETLDVTTFDEDLDAANLRYTATGLKVTPTARQLLEAPEPPSAVTEDNSALPFEDDEVPEWLAALVDDITAGAETDFARGIALQRWFRDSGNFEYSTARAAGNGIDELRVFLTPGPEGRVGYCEQFASAMAVMARVAGVPARVAVGFLRPDAVGASTWRFSAHDLHSWPELFFAGIGWVRFEPTPADQAPSVPGYTAGQLPELEEETDPTASASAPSASRSLRAEDPVQSGSTEPATADPSPWRWLWLLGLPLVALLLVGPRLLRVRQLRLRAAAGAAGGDRGAEAAWDELRATVLDLGHPWDDHTTLRNQQRRLLLLLHRPPVASRTSGTPSPQPLDRVRAGVDTVVRAVERARFSPAPVPAELGREAWARGQDIRQALWERSEIRQRRLATWWPRSLRVGGAPETGWTGGPGESAEDQVRAVLEDNVRV